MPTTKTPALHVVAPGTNRKPRGGLLTLANRHPAFGPAGQKLWDKITAEYQFVEAAEIELLQQACAAADRVDAVSKQIKADG
jgi:hypothetical protein